MDIRDQAMKDLAAFERDMEELNPDLPELEMLPSFDAYAAWCNGQTEFTDPYGRVYQLPPVEVVSQR